MSYKVFTGPACMFKTTTLCSLKDRGFNVVVGDFYQHTCEYPEFLEKGDNHLLDLEYQLFVFSKMVPGSIHDRWLGDNVIYYLVFQVIRNELSIQEALDSLGNICKRTFIPLLSSGIIDIVVFVPRSMELITKRMKKRNLMHDCLGERYASTQTTLFTEFAHLCNIPIFEVETIDDIDKHTNEVLDMWSLRPANSRDCDRLLYRSDDVLKRATSGSAGIDIPLAQSITLDPGVLTPVNLNVSIAIPPGYFGQLVGRSKLFKRNVEIKLGIIDRDYRGPLIVYVQNNSNELHSFSKGDSIVQLIIIPYAKEMELCKTVHLPPTQRGNGGFGSTDIIKSSCANHYHS